MVFAIPVQSLRPSAPDAVTLTKPVTPAEGSSWVVSTTKAFELAWTVPASPGPDQRILFGMLVFPTETPGSKWSTLHCSFPISAGSATIPPEIFADMKRRAGATTTADMLMWFFAGGQKEFTGGGASYVIEAVRVDSVSPARPGEFGQLE